MLDDGVQGPGVVKMETEEREGTTLRPGVSKLHQGLSPSLSASRKSRGQASLWGPLGSWRWFLGRLIAPFGGLGGVRKRRGRCWVDPCNNLVKTRTPKSESGGGGCPGSLSLGLSSLEDFFKRGTLLLFF